MFAFMSLHRFLVSALVLIDVVGAQPRGGLRGWNASITIPQTGSLAANSTGDVANAHDAGALARTVGSNMTLLLAASWPFKMGDGLSCPTGYKKITEEVECSQAASYYNWPYKGKVGFGSFPGGCYMGPYPNVYLNIVSVGAANAHATPLCAALPTTVPPQPSCAKMGEQCSAVKPCCQQSWVVCETGTCSYVNDAVDPPSRRRRWFFR